MNAISFKPRAALAHISATPLGWVIDTRGPYGERHYDFRSVGEAAELSLVPRDQGGWKVRFSPGAESVRRLVEELSEGGAHA